MAGEKKRQKTQENVLENRLTWRSGVPLIVLLLPVALLSVAIARYLLGTDCARLEDWTPKAELDDAVFSFLFVVGLALLLYIVALSLRWNDQKKSPRGRFKIRGHFRIEIAVSIGLALSLYRYYELWHCRGYAAWNADDVYVNIASSSFSIFSLVVVFFLLDKLFDRRFWQGA